MSNRMNEALRVLARRGKMLREQAESPIDYDHPADVEPVEEVWAGGDNIELQLDIANVQHGADEQVTEPEVMDITELRKFVREQIGKGSGLPTQEFARNQDSFESGSIPMETLIEELIDVGWLEGDVHTMEQVFDYIEDEGILDINDISLGAAGLGPDSGYELQYHGAVTIEEYMGDAPSGGMDPRGLGIREAHEAQGSQYSIPGSSGYSPDEDFSVYATDVASEAAYQANTIDGPKGRAAKKLFLDMMKEEVAEQKAAGVDAKKMTVEMNSIWKAVYR